MTGRVRSHLGFRRIHPVDADGTGCVVGHLNENEFFCGLRGRVVSRLK
jgi:hypothetical protein